MIDIKKIKQEYKEKVHHISHADYEKGKVVLAGDCVFDLLDIDKFFKGETVYNNGICGDTSSLLLETLYKRVIKYKPNKLFLSVGSNDMGFDGKNVKEIYNNIIDIVKEIKRRSSDTKIYLMTVLPVNPAQKDSINRDYVDTRDNFDINMLNYYIKNYARKNRIKFIDIHKHLKNDIDQLDLNYSIDGFHSNENGYEIVTKLILEQL